MRMFDAAEVADRLPYPALVDALRAAFAAGWSAPLRTRHDLADGASLLVMPAWTDAYAGIKLVNVFPANAAEGQAAVHSLYTLADGRTGRFLAQFDGEILTARRTAAASVLAASYLAPPDASRLLILGAGRIARELALAYAAVFPIRTIAVWNRTPARAAALVASLLDLGVQARVAGSLPDEVAGAAIVACATLSTAPLIRGAWLSSGAHLDLVGGFRPDMREADDAAIRQAWVAADVRAAVLAEAGDLIQPMTAGVIDADHVRTDLYELCQDRSPQRVGEEITLFKSVGHAVEDLAAAILCLTGEPGI